MASRPGGSLSTCTAPGTRPSSTANSSTAATPTLTAQPNSTPDERPTCVSYTDSGGSKVYIRFPINPWEALGLASNTASRDEVKMAFRNKITQPQRQTRALASLANHILTSTEPRYQRLPGSDLYTIQSRDHFTVAAYGDSEELRNMITENAALTESKDEHDRKLLYLACKSGFVDMVKMLLRNGATTDTIQHDDSTPLHAAAFFGHHEVVSLLLEYGARTDVRNTWNHIAFEESATTKISDMFRESFTDPISSLTGGMIKEKIISKVSVIEYQGKMVAKEFFRLSAVYDKVTLPKLPEIISTWKLTWHGTQSKNLESIMK